MNQKKKQEAADELLENIKTRLPMICELLVHISDEWSEEDLVYRFYHQSFKVYRMQEYAKKIHSELIAVAPSAHNKFQRTVLDPMFEEIYYIGTGNEFIQQHNYAWSLRTRPILEAFWHCKYFLQQAATYGTKLDKSPQLLPSGWATLLHLYGIR